MNILTIIMRCICAILLFFFFSGKLILKKYEKKYIKLYNNIISNNENNFEKLKLLKVLYTEINKKDNTSLLFQEDIQKRIITWAHKNGFDYINGENIIM